MAFGVSTRKDRNKRSKYKTCFDILQQLQPMFEVYLKNTKNSQTLQKREKLY